VIKQCRWKFTTSQSQCSNECTATHRPTATINPLECKGNDSTTSNNMKLVHCPLMGGLLYLVQRGRDWAPRSLLAVLNVTARQSTANVPITVLLYIGPLLRDFNVPFKGLSSVWARRLEPCTLWYQFAHSCRIIWHRLLNLWRLAQNTQKWRTTSSPAATS